MLCQTLEHGRVTILSGVCIEYSIFPFFPPPEEFGICVPTGKTLVLWVTEAVELDKAAQLGLQTPLLPTRVKAHDTVFTEDTNPDQLSNHMVSRHSGMS